MESVVTHEADLNLEATELRLGLPGRENEPVNDQSWSLRVNKRASHQMLSSTEESNDNSNSTASDAANGGSHHAIESSPPSKAQVVGWPPIRSYRKNNLQVKKSDAEVVGMFVKVSIRRGKDIMAQSMYLLMRTKMVIGCSSEMFQYTGTTFRAASVVW